MKKQLLLFVFLLSISINYAQTFNDGLLEYTVTGGTNVSVKKYNNICPTGNLIIPNTVVDNGITYTVTAIEPYAFIDCNSLTNVSVPNSVSSIGAGAFQSCGALTNINIPNSVTAINDSTFYYCTSLASISIPNSVTSIGANAFTRCESLTSISIPNSVTFINFYAFYRCSGITSLSIPNSVTFIDAYAFAKCTSLTSLDIPSSVNNIGGHVFENCTSLTSVTVHWATPLAVINTLFNNVNVSSIPLTVPAGTVSLYQAAAVWQDFNPINEAIPETYVPDDNFENYLETHDANGNIVPLGDPMSMGNGVANDDYVITARLNTVTNLNVITLAIVDMTGIEDFSALASLDCSANQIVNLDLSQNQNLTEVYCFNNQLSSLIFGNNTNLTTIECYGNSLSGFDVSQVQNLSYMDCGSNPLTTLDVSQNSQLATLYCGSTTLTQIDVSLNGMLTDFSCFSSTQLTGLNVQNGNNTNFTSFSALNCPNLSCIFVDNVAYSTANWTNVDPTSHFVTTQAECAALSTASFDFNDLELYPNPTNGKVHIVLEQAAGYTIVALNGQVLQKGNLSIGNNELNLSKLSKGLYFVKIKTDNGSAVKKIIIE